MWLFCSVLYTFLTRGQCHKRYPDLTELHQRQSFNFFLISNCAVSKDVKNGRNTQIQLILLLERIYARFLLLDGSSLTICYNFHIFL